MVEPTKYTLFCEAATRHAFLASPVPAAVCMRTWSARGASATGFACKRRGADDKRRYQSWAAGEAIQSETKSA